MKANLTAWCGLLLKLILRCFALFEHSIIIIIFNECIFVHSYFFVSLFFFPPLVSIVVIKKRDTNKKKAVDFVFSCVYYFCCFIGACYRILLAVLCMKLSSAPIKLSAFDHFSIKCNYFNLDEARTALFRVTYAYFG